MPSTKALPRPLLALPFFLMTLMLVSPTASAGSFIVTQTSPNQLQPSFLAFVSGDFTGDVQAVYFTILPLSGSNTRPIHAAYSASYLTRTNRLSTNGVLSIPIFGLYAGVTNSVDLAVQFTDGSVTSTNVQLSTPSYTDPCSAVNQRVIQQYRTKTSDIPYDYFILKDFCSVNSPAIFDTDGNFRWVGTAGVPSFSHIMQNNFIYSSDNKSGINRTAIESGEVSLNGQGTRPWADFSSYNVTNTGKHNIDPGRNGTLLVEIDTNASLENQVESTVLEFNSSGQVANIWDFHNIIQTAIAQNYPSSVYDAFAPYDQAAPADAQHPPVDWFHINSALYNPSDNTLVVSSRESGVFAVDYDQTDINHPRKIHWILGDTRKVWYTYLSQYSLSLGSQSNNDGAAPVGQHAISIDSLGHLLLMNDGLHSIYENPAGLNRPLSFVTSYLLDLRNRLAYPSYAYYNGSTTYNSSSSIYSDVCGSVYDFSGAHLVDYANEQIQSSGSGTSTQVDVQGVSASNNLIFRLIVPNLFFQAPSSMDPMLTGCSSGWNAVPLDLSNMVFQ